MRNRKPADKLSDKCGLSNSPRMAAIRPGEAATTQLLRGNGVRWFSGAALPREFESLSDLGRQLDVEGILDRRAI